ncbi:hypothetical protein [Phyllobacterium chamaecytisi]|uniref:hypothetical protein n=1 Tax=Phyllobacterium chamaecytisi TaxID=2876082 RepID=UPI001CCDA0C2|nr:hypothetical protein [Phyllobacterium sp. KW56]MBZ9605228.1 hypothetical protein [Phyllobacterium sp. KW56]
MSLKVIILVDRGSMSKERKPGALAAFPYDRMTVERFREAFPRARWNNDKRAWFVPGKTAVRRLDRWLAREADQALPHADAKGRDAYAFEPITSAYLEAADDLRVRTPYSKTVIEQMRAIPWAHWDEELRAWRVPFRSYEELLHRWTTIEAAARRNEPEERKRRLGLQRNSSTYKAAQLRYAERRRRRYPLPTEDLPPLERPLMTERYGIVAFTEVSGELVDPASLALFYPHAALGMFNYVWGRWRAPTLAELVATWPARRVPEFLERSRGWWQPTLSELRLARQRARSVERRRQQSARMTP